MTKQRYIILFFISLVFYTAVSVLQKTPGYMDASYYYAVGEQIATGKGAVEPFLWNYLNNPQQIPVTAFTYWMPLVSLLSALGMWAIHSSAFWAARIPFILLASCIPLLTVYLTFKISNSSTYLWLAGVFSLLSGAYLPYLTLAETFTPFFVLGALFFLTAFAVYKDESNGKHLALYCLLIGLIAGLMHLTRADGILWLIGGLFVVFQSKEGKKKPFKWFLLNSLVLVIGYFVIMSGWFIRNFLAFGSPFPPGSNLALWFTHYNDLFLYPASLLDRQHLFESGLSEILKVRGLAAVNNLGNLLAVVGSVVLLPFMGLGIWKTRRDQLTQFALVMICSLFVLMSLVFPFAGYRGGFFHSMSALQIYLWVMAIVGLDVVVHWTVKHLKWVEVKSRTLFSVVLLLSIGFYSAFEYVQKVEPFNQVISGWDQEYKTYRALDLSLRQISGGSDYSVMVNDAPSYYVATGRTSIQLTSGSMVGVGELMEKFHIDYLLIDKNVPVPLEDLYSHPGDRTGLQLQVYINDYYIYSRK
jgi:hypothetical protein